MTTKERAEATPAVELSGLGCVYEGGVQALVGVDLRVEPGTYLTVVGPSGSGKSTLLRLVAGLQRPSSGTVRLAGREATGLSPRERDLALVFQYPSLYPHLSVFDNLAFGLRARGASRGDLRARVNEVADLLGLGEVLRRRPATLSGGQRQRVALGRAIARRPSVFLLDEPLSSLDGPLRSDLRDSLRALHARTRATLLHVTHDQAEALALGDRVGVMERGRLIQVGSPREVHERPATRFVAEFLGSPPMSMVRCRLSGGPAVELEGGEMSCDRVAGPKGRLVDLGVRPEHVWLADEEIPPGLARWPGLAEVNRVEFRGHETIATVTLGSQILNIRLGAGRPVRRGDRVPLAFDMSRVSWFDPETGRAIMARAPCE